MPINILMPALSPTMEKGNLAKWLKKEGDKVKAGDILAEIETDKATMEYEAIDEGVIAKILVPEGTADIAVNQPIAVLATEGEDVKAAAGAAAAVSTKPASSASGPHPAPAASPSPKTGRESPAAPAAESYPSPSSGRVASASEPGGVAAVPHPTGPRFAAARHPRAMGEGSKRGHAAVPHATPGGAREIDSTYCS